MSELEAAIAELQGILQELGEEINFNEQAEREPLK